MNRSERRAAARAMREQARAWPPHLIEVPGDEWPAPTPGVERPLAVWRSRSYLVLRYAAPALNGIEVRRLTVNRVTIASSGHWEQDIPWDDLQIIKRETGHGAWYGVEIYPRDRDLVYVANMRHLWLMAEPLQLGWFEKESP